MASIDILDVGNRPVAYTIATGTSGAVITDRFSTKDEADQALSKAQNLTPPLLTDGRVVPVLSTMKARKGGGRKSNAVKAAEAAKAAQPTASSGPNASGRPEKATQAAQPVR